MGFRVYYHIILHGNTANPLIGQEVTTILESHVHNNMAYLLYCIHSCFQLVNAETTEDIAAVSGMPEFQQLQDETRNQRLPMVSTLEHIFSLYNVLL